MQAEFWKAPICLGLLVIPSVIAWEEHTQASCLEYGRYVDPVWSWFTQPLSQGQPRSAKSQTKTSLVNSNTGNYLDTWAINSYC